MKPTPRLVRFFLIAGTLAAIAFVLVFSGGGTRHIFG
jgi:hypothetical protein